jgi:Rrf2 family transcriptional regulator, nitric oxide-sensitive transcriptional repressor
MRLTQFSDYSLRLLLYLAERSEKPATIGDIARWYGVSKPHLVKVAHNLVKLGYVHSTQGRGGGLRLARLPEEINIATLIRHTEPDLHVVECFDRVNNTCRITRSCKLKHVLHDATGAFFKSLEQHTLQSIASLSKTTKP